MNRTGMTLDETDRKLVALLRHDARRTTTSLARALNLSRTAVQARIARLERDGIIQGYSAMIAPDVVAGVQALVTLCLAVRPCRRITDPLLSWPEVERIYAIAGDRDAVLVVSVASPQALSELADRLRAVEGIVSVETTVILSARAGCPEKA
ncbi:Lrp/AsnC family leucine-responsive transcriptional regulator [Sphingomonas sp. SORGH_AS870]|uniref:Lrp/AsnC family transcriptional regulator n=1 Tax=Sphingomonas sp. SORGH_AS_0870 TaxID=3041801 RepID=UPI0028594165|nr:Lrp/AsnC family transcriptional regulator [Sphingomonas sp. SORGH_AS_0870]MDR6146546.1 Lrp/AsnC family leucine-responsive transcriptional regulator [Sphingomonas sp. SORGH_AS_0870]